MSEKEKLKKAMVREKDKLNEQRWLRNLETVTILAHEPKKHSEKAQNRFGKDYDKDIYHIPVQTEAGVVEIQTDATTYSAILDSFEAQGYPDQIVFTKQPRTNTGRSRY